jgi:hypothetical protein
MLAGALSIGSRNGSGSYSTIAYITTRECKFSCPGGVTRMAQKHFDSTNVQQFFSELISKKSNERTVAIVGAAFVDDLLRQLLEFHFVCSNNVKKRLLDIERPLGTFSSRIDICAAIGLIGPITLGNLNCIREIRNKFSHQILMPTEDGGLGGVSFKTKAIKDWCDSLKPNEHGTKPWNRLFNKKGSPKDKFVRMCLLITIVISDHLIKAHEQPPQATPIMP